MLDQKSNYINSISRSLNRNNGNFDSKHNNQLRQEIKREYGLKIDVWSAEIYHNMSVMANERS